MEYIVLVLEMENRSWFYSKSGSTKTIFSGDLKSAKKFKKSQEFEEFLNKNKQYKTDKYRFWVMKDGKIIQSYRMHNA